MYAFFEAVPDSSLKHIVLVRLARNTSRKFSTNRTLPLAMMCTKTADSKSSNRGDLSPTPMDMEVTLGDCGDCPLTLTDTEATPDYGGDLPRNPTDLGTTSNNGEGPSAGCVGIGEFCSSHEHTSHFLAIPDPPSTSVTINRTNLVTRR